MQPRVFRSKAAWVLGWIWVVFAAFNTVDLIVRGRLPSALVAGAVLGVLTAIIFITCLRPCVLMRDDGVLVRNPLRDAFVPWRALDGVRVAQAIIIDAGERSVRCWTPQSSARERAKAVRRGEALVGGRQGRWPSAQPRLPKSQQAAATAFAGRTHADWVAEQISETARERSRDLARKAGRTGETGTVGEAVGGDAAAAATSSTVTTVTWSWSALVAVGTAIVLVVAAVLSSL